MCPTRQVSRILGRLLAFAFLVSSEFFVLIPPFLVSGLASPILRVPYETDAVQQEFAVRHGNIPGAKVCILAMGRLGSRELTAESDLDLIFLYDFDGDAIQSDGDKPLDPTLYFIRLIQRFIAEYPFAGLFLCGAPLDLTKMRKTPPLYWFAGSRDSERFQAANPISYLKEENLLPTLFLHGTSDGLVEYDWAGLIERRIRTAAPALSMEGLRASGYDFDMVAEKPEYVKQREGDSESKRDGFAWVHLGYVETYLARLDT